MDQKIETYQNEVLNDIPDLPNDRNVDQCKLMAFANGNLDVVETVESLNDYVENIVGKGEDAGLPAFSPFSTMFSTFFVGGGGEKWW